MSATNEPQYLLLWKGIQSGPFSLAVIREKLGSGDISRMHQVNFNGRWIILDEFLEKQGGDSDARRRAEAEKREKQMRHEFESQLAAERARKIALEERLAKAESRSSPQQAPPPETRDAQYWLNIDGTQYGPYSESQVRELWQSGSVNAATSCWKDGFADWLPLSKVFKPTAPNQPNTAPEREVPQGLSGQNTNWNDSETPQTLKRLSLQNLLPLGACILGLGWLAFISLPLRVLPPNSNSIIAILLLAVPAVYLSVVAALYFLRPKKTQLRTGLLSLLFTMTAGLVILLTFQKLAEWAGSHHFFSANKIEWILRGFALAYRQVDSSNPNLVGQFFGFIFGVGLCEETTKLLPLFFILTLQDELPQAQRISYRGFLFVGFLSGTGFGIGEALYGYAPWSGAPIASLNVLRWFALVPSHAVWAATAAACLWRLSPTLRQETKRKNSHWRLFGLCAAAVACSAVIHGLYDVFAVNEYQSLAIAFEAGSLIALFSVTSQVDTWTRTQPEMEAANNDVTKSDWLGCHASVYQTKRYLFGVVFAVAIGMILLVEGIGVPLHPVSSNRLQMNDKACDFYRSGYVAGQLLKRLSKAEMDAICAEATYFGETIRTLSPAMRQCFFDGVWDGNQGHTDKVAEWRIHNQ